MKSIICIFIIIILFFCVKRTFSQENYDNKLILVSDTDANITTYGSDEMVPKGTIILWSKPTIPNGWALCDGRAVTINGVSVTTPNLINKFIKGGDLKNSSSTTKPRSGTEGGQSSITLTTQQMPPHTHTVGISAGCGFSDGDGKHHHNYNELAQRYISVTEVSGKHSHKYCASNSSTTKGDDELCGAGWPCSPPTCQANTCKKAYSASDKFWNYSSFWDDPNGASNVLTNAFTSVADLIKNIATLNFETIVTASKSQGSAAGSHTHTVSIPEATPGTTVGPGKKMFRDPSQEYPSSKKVSTEHSHTIASKSCDFSVYATNPASSFQIIPPFIDLVYIMKL
jgi:hypothetical protein